MLLKRLKSNWIPQFSLFFLILFLSSCEASQTSQTVSETKQTSTGQQAPSESTTQKAPGASTEKKKQKAPAYVYEVWEYVTENGRALPGYVGGRTFENREKRLPMRDPTGKQLKYREWDVKIHQKGVNRGAERLVTGSDKSAYYTKDHYKSFTRIDK